jgi:hypothetical protein
LECSFVLHCTWPSLHTSLLMPVPVGGASLRCEGWNCENAIFDTRCETSKQWNTSNRAQDKASFRDAFEMADMQPRHSCCLSHRVRSASRSKDVKSQLRVCSPQARVFARQADVDVPCNDLSVPRNAPPNDLSAPYVLMFVHA